MSRIAGGGSTRGEDGPAISATLGVARDRETGATSGTPHRVIKVAAFVVRMAPGSEPQLLVYVPDDNPSLPPRVPGGGVDDGEVPRQAVRREVLEETGLDRLELVRPLGVHRYFKPYLGKNVERHDFLLRAIDWTPDSWRHRVLGRGGDAGDLVRLWWSKPGELGGLDEEHRATLTPAYLPELFRPAP